MRLLLALCWSGVSYLGCQATTSPKPTPQVGHDRAEESESTEEIHIASNESLYTTAEMRDMVMKEMAGKTEEVQAYFDEFPSEEFKENSEDLKLKWYYERKALKDVDSKQIYNITPVPYREPPGSMYTIEVNDSYVPKYRMTTSEELRLEREDTFHPDKTDETSVPLKRVNEDSDSDDDSSSDDSDEPSGKTRKKAKSKWPRNMDPKKKKKSKDDSQLAKRKNMVEREINGLNLKGRNSVNNKRNTNLGGKGGHKEMLHSPNKAVKYNQNKRTDIQQNVNERRPQDKLKSKSNFNGFMDRKPYCKHDESPQIKPQQSRRRSRLPQQGPQDIRPFL